MGSDNRYDDDEWLGWNGQDFEGTIDLGSTQQMDTVTTRFFNKPSDWVYMPVWVSLSVSDNGTDFKEIARRTDLQSTTDGMQALKFYTNAVHARYLKITAKCYGPIEKGKPGEGNPGWLFVDEVKVE
jgi:hexosaminidase